MADSSLDRKQDPAYKDALIAALQGILTSQQVRTEPLPHLIYEYRGTGRGAPRYRVADNSSDLGRDWFPVSMVTTGGHIFSVGGES